MHIDHVYEFIRHNLDDGEFLGRVSPFLDYHRAPPKCYGIPAMISIISTDSKTAR